jgi:hypothetical protein
MGSEMDFFFAQNRKIAVIYSFGCFKGSARDTLRCINWYVYYLEEHSSRWAHRGSNEVTYYIEFYLLCIVCCTVHDEQATMFTLVCGKGKKHILDAISQRS